MTIVAYDGFGVASGVRVAVRARFGGGVGCFRRASLRYRCATTL